MAKKLIVGLDFDGVVAYNPARLARFPISFIKRNILGIHKVNFFVPKTPLARSLWALAHETSVIPARGTGLLKHLVESGEIEAHLVTARFGFLEGHLYSFLRRWGLDGVFKTITLNKHEEQPHMFKARMIREKKLHYFVEDNWDIVSYLSKQKSKTSIHWIYNLLDRRMPYTYKYPYLLRSLEAMLDKSTKRT